MNAHVQSPMTYAEKLQAEHKARQVQQDNEAPRRSPVVAKKPARVPMWTVVPMRFDEHVRVYERKRLKRVILAGSPVKAYIHERCDQLGVDIKLIMGATRKRKVVEARQLLMWEIKTHVKPEITLPELGRLFDRDHTTVLHAVQPRGREEGEG